MADQTQWEAGSTASRSTTRKPAPTIFQEDAQIPSVSSPPFVASALANATAAKGQQAMLTATAIAPSATETPSPPLAICNGDDEASFMIRVLSEAAGPPLVSCESDSVLLLFFSFPFFFFPKS